jgi:hypothetical protein
MDNLDLINQRLQRLEEVVGNFENIDQTKVFKRIYNLKENDFDSSLIVRV